MSFSHLFEHDQQFMRLVRRETDVDLVTAALEIARDGQNDLSFEPTRSRLQKSIARLTHPVTQAGSDVEELKLLKSLEKQIDATTILAYALTEIMPTQGANAIARPAQRFPACDRP